MSHSCTHNNAVELASCIQCFHETRTQLNHGFPQRKSAKSEVCWQLWPVQCFGSTPTRAALALGFSGLLCIEHAEAQLLQIISKDALRKGLLRLEHLAEEIFQRGGLQKYRPDDKTAASGNSWHFST